jgi:hypothetical protein
MEHGLRTATQLATEILFLNAKIRQASKCGARARAYALLTGVERNRPRELEKRSFGLHTAIGIPTDWAVLTESICRGLKLAADLIVQLIQNVTPTRGHRLSVKLK